MENVAILSRYFLKNDQNWVPSNHYTFHSKVPYILFIDSKNFLPKLSFTIRKISLKLIECFLKKSF